MGDSEHAASLRDRCKGILCTKCRKACAITLAVATLGYGAVGLGRRFN